MMNRKNILILSIVTTAVTLSACGSDTSNISEENTESETIASADSETTETTDTETESNYSIAWIVLGKLDNYQELRNALETALSITTNDTNEKEGILYKNPDTLETDQNTTLLMNLRNQDYSLKFAEGNTDEISAASESSFSDTDEDSQLAATINAYYNLLPDETEGVFNGDATLTRAEAMALVMRATTPVIESGEPESNESFTSAVGYTSFTDYASAVDSNAFLNVTKGTLNTENFTTAMTEGEYTYLVIKTIVADYDNYIKTNAEYLGLTYDTYMSDFNDTSSVELTTIKDAGDITLTDALANPDNGVPSDMLNTFKLGIKLGMITESDLEDWDTAITKTDAITNLTNEAANFMFNDYSKISDYLITSDTKDTATTRHETTTESSTETYEDTRPASEVTAETCAAASIVEEYGSAMAWNSIAQENGADYTSDYYWIYKSGSAAGDGPSYAVYKREGSPYYGQVFYYGDTLLDGSTNLNGTNDEYYAWLGQDTAEKLEEKGYDVDYNDDGSWNVNIDFSKLGD
jgi:hypothetical protein